MWNYGQTSKNKMVPIYLAIITQLILQIFIVINMITFILEPIRFSRVIGLILVILIGIGIIMALITIFISIDYWKDNWVDFNNSQFRTCILSVIMGIIIGGFVLFTLAVP